MVGHNGWINVVHQHWNSKNSFKEVSDFSEIEGGLSNLGRNVWVLSHSMSGHPLFLLNQGND
jgi:hypothetical protein